MPHFFGFYCCSQTLLWRIDGTGDHKVTVSSGIDRFYPPLGLEPATYASEAQADRYLNSCLQIESN
jgi:hypothetical protein